MISAFIKNSIFGKNRDPWQTYHDLIPPITGVLPVGGLDAGLASWSLLSTLAGMETSWRGTGKWTIELISLESLETPSKCVLYVCLRMSANCSGGQAVKWPTPAIIDSDSTLPTGASQVVFNCSNRDECLRWKMWPISWSVIRDGLMDLHLTCFWHRCL